MRWTVALVPFLLAGAAPLTTPPAQEAVVPVAPPPAPEIADPDPIDPVLFETLALAPHDLRMAVPVRIGDNQDYRFVIDTGAERTVIARELADRLSLGDGPAVGLVSLSGHSRVPTVAIPQISFTPRQEPLRVQAPALSYRNLGTSGLLGVDLLAGHRVVIDVDRRSMQVHKSSKRTRPRPQPGEIIVTATSRMGQLIVTDAEYAGTRIRVIIDTGSGLTIANGEMRKLVGERGRALGSIPITSVTGQTVSAEYRQIGRFRVGGLSVNNAAIAFADVAPFKVLGLDDVPAMLLGMDAFRMFRRVEIDFANRDIAFELRDRPGWTTHRL